MFSLSGLQPQILTAVSEIASLINLPRVCVSMPTRKQHTNTEKQVHSQVHEENTTSEKTSKNNKIFQQLPQELTIKELYPLLTADFEAVSQLSREVPYKINKDLWRESFVSAETFFENKTGFPESRIKVPDKYSISSTGIRNTELHRFLQASVQHLFFQQNRQFKTKRSIPRERTAFFQSPSFIKKVSSTEEKFDESTSTSKNEDVLKHTSNEDFVKNETASHTSNAKATTMLSQVEIEKIIDEKFKKRRSKFFLYIFLLYLFYTFVLKNLDNAFFRRIRQGLGQEFEVNPAMVDVSFDDVRGASEAKQELQDIVEFLKNPERFTSLGGKLPKGVLLVGPPGTGKTLLARAVAGEAGVPFLYCSGSDFDRIFVGSGTMKVKMLFETARQKAPCVIFIDEIDSVARKRTGSDLHPYANQTINSLLSEIDGFNQSKGVIIIGATNRLEDIDKAVLRPGRFDVQVKVHIPDLKERVDILELYLGKVVASKSIDVLSIARGTPSFTGADLESLVNKAALRAAFLGDTAITMEHIEFAKDNILMGPAKKNKIDNVKSLQNTAIHEGGHTVVAYYTKHADPLNKVTIIPRGQALGFTSLLPEKDVYNLTKSQLLAKMDVCMGGRVAEELINGSGEVTTGATSDFEEATRIATSMVKHFGMSDEVGVRYYQEGNKGTQSKVDKEIDKLLQESYKRAKDLLTKHAEEHKRLVEALMMYETLDAEQIKAVMEGKRLRNILRR